MMKIGLLGFGAMGKAIKTIAEDRGIEISEIYDIDNPLTNESICNFDVALDFSTPSAVVDNARLLCSKRKNFVIGATGWYEHFCEVRGLVLESGTGAVFGTNFSIGMNIFSRIVATASELINGLDDYDVFMHEIHHKRKKDSPSGTALSLANIILSRVDSKKSILTNTPEGCIDSSALHVSSTRGGEVFGTHSVYIDSLADTIELVHRAKNRMGLASGAVSSAQWIAGKSGFYNFEEIVGDILNSK
jgi:4-hydroxy-tetrahydrodipicolinate reductase